MAYLPIHSPVGTIQIMEVFDFYDIPRLFLGANQIGQLFLAYNLDDDRQQTEWYYLPVSPERICRMKMGELSLRKAFLDPELGMLYFLQVSYSDGITSASLVPKNDVNPDWIPEAEELLCPPRMAERTVSESLVAKALRLNRECLDLRMMFSRQDQECAPMRHLGHIWVSLQQLVDNLCSVANGTAPSNHGKLPFTLTNQSELLVEASYVGSYGSHIVASQPVGLTENSLLTDGLTRLSEIMDDSLGTSNIKSILEPLGPRCATRYRVLLEQMVAARVDIEIQRASPDVYHNSYAKISKDMAKYIADRVKSVETEMLDQHKVGCTITAYDSNRNTFALEVIEDGSLVSGKVEKDAIPAEMFVAVKDRYSATIREIVEVNSMTGSEKTKYTLAKLEDWCDMEY